MLAAADFISAIYQTKGGVILIDELENGIHYSVLEKIWWQIKRASQRTETQVIVTTHSRECLQAAKAAFIKEPVNRGLGLIRLWRDSKNSDAVRAAQYDAKELDEALSLDLDVR
jgi:AAA15 family ATPase/GTPase